MARIRNAEDASSFLSEFVGQSYPPVDPVKGKSDRVQRCWTLRTVRTIAGIAEEDLEEVLSNAAALVPEGEGRSDVDVHITILDENHAILVVDFAEGMGYHAMAANWGVLTEVDRLWGIEDLEGLPSDLWAPLRWSRNARRQPSTRDPT